MKEVIKTYPENIVNHMKTVANSLKYTALAQHLENSAGAVPPVSRNDEQSNKLTIKADSVVRAIWKGMGFGAAREMGKDGYQNEVVDVVQENRR